MLKVKLCLSHFDGASASLFVGGTNPAVSRALLITVNRLLDLELDVSPFDAAVQAFGRQCDQAVAQDATMQAYGR
jgi:hypothetical protein